MGKVFSGTRARFKLNGTPVAFSTSISTDKDLEDLEPIDISESLKGMEFVSGKYSGTFSSLPVKPSTPDSSDSEPTS